jgi:hypothetical protein
MKPVAYISPNGILYKELPPDSMLELTPLYAMRELTDREIMELYCLTSDNDPLDFARAILQKAIEK